MQAIFGFLGSAVGAVVTLVAAAAGMTFFLIAWKSGILPVLGEGFLLILKGVFVDIPLAILRFLGDLLTAAQSL